MKRRKTAILLSTLAICSTMMVTANAESTATTQFEYTLKNDPTYTVEIPAKITITDEGTDMVIKATDVKYLDGKKVSVSISGTDYFRNQMVLENEVDRSVMRYQIVKADGTVIETTGQKDQVNGVEVAAFTEDGQVVNKVMPVKLPSTKVGTFTGTMSFDIGLVDAE